ncbi:unnamed protein product [Arctogadus glacialis]
MVTSLFVFFLGLKNASQSKELLKSHRERDVEQESHFEPVHRKDVVLAKPEMRRRLKNIIYHSPFHLVFFQSAIRPLLTSKTFREKETFKSCASR